jgi:branched-chain amino acid transport system ATP-binding protein
MLEIKEIRKIFGGIHAVDGCSLTVLKGTITGLIGPNGAGKTTLFNLITGFYKPDGGEILFKGNRIDGLPPHKIFRNRICRTFQITREFAHMTLLENLMVMPQDQLGEKIWNSLFWQNGVRAQERVLRDKALEILDFFELIHMKDEYAKNLSGGQKKLLEIAKTQMADPELILLDEPGAGVNRTLMKKLVENIKSLCTERGITFLVIEHDMDMVMNLCNPVIVMSEGRKLSEGTPEEIKNDERVLEAYLGGQYR